MRPIRGHISAEIGHLANLRIPPLADVSDGFSLYSESSWKHKEVKMELTLRQYGITVKVLRARAEESTPHIVKRLYRRNNSEQHPDHQKECLQACGSRYVSPLM